MKTITETQPPATRPGILTSPILARERFEQELLRISVEEVLRAQKPRRRSELARCDYLPEAPVVLPVTKKSLLNGLRRLVHPAAVLALATLGALAIKTSNDWFATHYAYGALIPEEPVRRAQAPLYSADPAVALEQQQEFARLPKLLPPWKWIMLPFSLASDEKGHPSFWLAGRDKGTLRRKEDLPKTGEIGDEYQIADGGSAWVWMLPTGAKMPSWIDP